MNNSAGYFFILIFLFLTGLVVPVGAELSAEQMYSLLNQANEAFRQANSITDEASRADKLYEKAILSFEKIINEGKIENAKLYYNLGNAYFLKGDIGRAILNYRRAEKLDSADANIKKNLSFARSRRVDKVQVKTEKRILRTLFFWHYDFSMKSKFVITCILFAAVCIGLTIIIWLGRSVPAVGVTVICGILMICFLGSLVLESRDRAVKICGVITTEQVVARQGDGQNYPASFTDPLHSGLEFDVLERRGGWLHIALSDGSDGWIPENSASLI